MMRKSFVMSIGAVVLCAAVLYPAYNTFGGHKRSMVRSSKETPRKDCKTTNKFKWYQEVRVTGKRFPPLTNVDIYARPNKKWKDGDSIGTDVSSDGPETVATGYDGHLPCTTIWVQPLTSGKYDIVVDANQDGTYNKADGDAIDGRKQNPGFKVK